MPTYDELSTEDQSVVQATVQLIRATCGSTGRNFNAIAAIADDTNAIAIISSVTGTIPNESGLAGADDMTKAELVAIWNDFAAMATTHDTAGNRAAWSKAAGVTNLLGVG